MSSIFQSMASTLGPGYDNLYPSGRRRQPAPTAGGTTLRSLVEGEDQIDDQGGPAGLVPRTEPGAVVAVEVLREDDQVLPVRVGLQRLVGAVDRAAPPRIRREQRDQPPGQVVRHLAEVHLVLRTGRVLHHKVLAEERRVLAERLDQQEIDRHPDRPPPVRVAPEQAT